MDTLTPRGPFSLKAAAEFGFGPTEGRVPAFDGVMRLAFAVDGGAGYAAATLRQSEPDAPVARRARDQPAARTPAWRSPRWLGSCRSITTARRSSASASATR